MKPLVMVLLLTTFSQSLLAQTQQILFGSCSHHDDDLNILDAVNREQAEAFFFLGDNIYGDTEDMTVLAEKYNKLGSNQRFKQLREKFTTYAIWDDHDYGANDAGVEYPMKQKSREIMLDFWKESIASERRTRDSGIYTSYTLGHGENLIRVIMPDLRWNRPALKAVPSWQFYLWRNWQNRGPYKPHTDPSISMLGEEQWQWLVQELKKPAKVRVIASSLQVLADFTGWESWSNFPGDKQRLFNLIQQQKINGVVLISGDTHWGELSKYQESLDYPLWEMTSSGLSEEWKQISPNKYRYGSATSNINYGGIEVDWKRGELTLRLRDVDGNSVIKQKVSLASISPY